jgi:hypothetical protein
MRITEGGEGYGAVGRPVFLYNFNSASTAWNPIWGTNATTMTIVSAANYIRFNNSAITTTTTGVSMYTQRVFKIEDGADLEFYLKHSNATAGNKLAEFGLGYYNFAAGQANQMNEFIGFRWTTSGGLLGVFAGAGAGAPAEQLLPINGNLPYSDNVFRSYKVVISDAAIEYWVAGTFIGSLNRVLGTSFVTKAIAYPFIGRICNTGTASAAATYDLSNVILFKYGGEEDLAYSARNSLMGKSTMYAQPDILVASTNPHQFPATTVAPTANTPSNTASSLNNTALLGGMTATTMVISATEQSNYIVAAYQNPSMPTAAGAALNARALIVTSISISRAFVTTVLAGGPLVTEWFVSQGSTTTALDTADSNGTTAVAQKGGRSIPLSAIDSYVLNTPAATVVPRAGDDTHFFTTPLVVQPGEYLHIGFRTLSVTAQVTTGAIAVNINVNGYWE